MPLKPLKPQKQSILTIPSKVPQLPSEGTGMNHPSRTKPRLLKLPVSLGRTINLANFNSGRIDIGVELDVAHLDLTPTTQREVVQSVVEELKNQLIEAQELLGWRV